VHKLYHFFRPKQNSYKWNGEYRPYYENGQLCVVCYYVHGKIDGAYRQYHKNGKISGLHHSIYGKENGEYTMYDLDSKITEWQFSELVKENLSILSISSELMFLLCLVYCSKSSISFW
jgi:hypothetical protein